MFHLCFTQKWCITVLFVILQKENVWEKSGAKMLSTNQIAVFFDHQYFWKESSNILVIFHGVSLQAKTAPEKVVVWLDIARFIFHAIRLHDSLIIYILGESE